MLSVLRQSIVLLASADRAWSLIADPIQQAEWNPHIVSIDRDRAGPAILGEQFATLYQLNGRESESHVEVTKCDPLREIVFRHRTSWKNSDSIVEEAFLISEFGDGVRVVQTIDLSLAGILWPVRACIWLVNRIGWSAEEPQLHRLKRLAETAMT